ncbi:MAG: AMP-binding protein [bacterium]|nr:AMP-binding protein [bacterium]
MNKITDKLKSVVDKYPNVIAYKIGEKSITYKELWDNSLVYSEYLKREGSSPVILYGNKSISIVVSIISCIMAKRCYIPINILTPKNRIEDIIKQSKSSLMITNEKIKLNNINICSLEQLSKFKCNNLNECNNDIVYIIFTSGSTGIPKGVPISHYNLENFINWISNLKPLSKYKNINVLNQASFSFDLSVADLFYSFTNGHTLISLDNNFNENYNMMFEVIRKEKINLMVITPTFIKLCLLNNNFNNIFFPDLKCIYFCGELLEVNVVKKIISRFPNIKLINAYGPTEATSAISAVVIDENMLNSELLPVGDINNLASTVEIINDEIVIKGSSVFNGYLGETIGGYYKDKNINCYKTGDLGYIHNNYLYCKGRIDSQVKYKGYRIELFDIENNINKINGVNYSAVVALKNKEGVTKVIKAFVTVNNDISLEYIKNELEKKLPKYMIPSIINIVNEIPLNKNGKIDRKALVDL